MRAIEFSQQPTLLAPALRTLPDSRKVTPPRFGGLDEMMME
jgi:hypothetical protein